VCPGACLASLSSSPSGRAAQVVCGLWQPPEAQIVPQPRSNRLLPRIRSRFRPPAVVLVTAELQMVYLLTRRLALLSTATTTRFNAPIPPKLASLPTMCMPNDDRVKSKTY
jgi:hypothetical protein